MTLDEMKKRFEAVGRLPGQRTQQGGIVLEKVYKFICDFYGRWHDLGERKNKTTYQQILFDLESAFPQVRLRCLWQIAWGLHLKMTRRECFLVFFADWKLSPSSRCPFTTVDDAISRLKSLEHWPVAAMRH